MIRLRFPSGDIDVPGLQIEQLTPMIGSIVHNIDLTDPRQVTTHAKALHALLMERQVIFFRDQRLDPESQVGVARVFGSVRPVASTFPVHPENPCVEMLRSQGSRTGTDVWHTDLTW